MCLAVNFCQKRGCDTTLTQLFNTTIKQTLEASSKEERRGFSALKAASIEALCRNFNVMLSESDFQPYDARHDHMRTRDWVCFVLYYATIIGQFEQLFLLITKTSTLLRFCEAVCQHQNPNLLEGSGSCPFVC